MLFTRFLPKAQVDQLEFEVISTALRTFLTRELRSDLSTEAGQRLAQMCGLMNRGRTVEGRPIYVLRDDGWGDYHPAEHAYIEGEFELIFRRSSTIELVELIAELAQDGWFRADYLNEWFRRDGSSISFERSSGKVQVHVDALAELEARHDEDQDAHPNIRVLIKRMDDCLGRNDLGGVLHASASVFETMAKDVVAIPSVQDQTLKSFFGRYRKDSSLPAEILDYIDAIYVQRNSTPLAGHGSTKAPEISDKEAVILTEMTRAFVKIEYQLRNPVSAPPRK
jgi:hypothetical protein